MSLQMGVPGLRSIVQPVTKVSTRCFSVSAVQAGRLDPELRKKGFRTLGRQDMKRFLENLERRWEESRRDGRQTSTGFYLGPHADQPFPLNPQFRSQPVLSEPAREWIYRRVALKGEPLKLVSAELGVDVRRVAAVVRLKQVEKRWIAEGKTLAVPYANAIMSMLPQTRYVIPKPGETIEQQPHEPINELYIHGHTQQQIFWPVAESRSFTREDAAEVFHPAMRTPEERSMHKELVKAEKLAMAEPSRRQEHVDRWKVELVKAEKYRKISEENAQKAKAALVAVKSDRFEFRFQDFNSENVGKDGRSRTAIGHRYGVPNYDRRRGEVKIPTSVP